MLKYTESAMQLTLPVVPMTGIVAFPSIPISFEVSNKAAVAACEKANKDGGDIFLLTQKVPMVSDPEEDDMYTVGTAAKIKQFVKLPEGNIRIIAEGYCRGTVLSMNKVGDVFVADIMSKSVNIAVGGVREEAAIRELITLFDRFTKHLPKMSNDLVTAVKGIKSAGLLADFIASNVLISFSDKQLVLNEYEPLRRAEALAVIMEREIGVLKTELQIHQKVRAKIDANQREYYLREQLKVIQSELGNSGDDNEIDEYYEKIDAAHLPKEVAEKLEKEVRKLEKTPFNSAESSVIRSYLDTCLEFPWSAMTKDSTDIALAKKILERDHDGLDKVKERILEYLAVKQLSPNLNNQIICLVGPPGTGKTSIARSIADALKRKYVRVSLGGVRDEADIRGHRKTYIGSMPGRIVNALVQSQVRNPLMLLDEIDKLTHDAHGDPASALLEVLDSEQNKAFRDHFMEIPVDLSECVFIATANTLDTVPRPLLDRMEIIELKIYTRSEKAAIAHNHLIPKQMKRHGLNKRMLKISDEAVYDIIDYYTREAGVRNLEREIASICRRAAKILVESGKKSCSVNPSNLKDFLGRRKIKPEKIADKNEIGVVNGMAYTELGGELLQVEVAAVTGSGKIELTGSLGDVMKESAKAAISCVRAISERLSIDPDFYKTKDIHIHVPEGAVPKDGPSAGVTMTTALVSELTGIPVRRDVAMTGEITLRGRVLPIGGLKEKTMAAYMAGVRTILIPKDNEDDLDDVDSIVKENVRFVLCSSIQDVLSEALEDRAEGGYGIDAVKDEIKYIPDMSGINDKSESVRMCESEA